MTEDIDVILLLRPGSDVNVLDNEGWSPPDSTTSSIVLRTRYSCFNNCRRLQKKIIQRLQPCREGARTEQPRRVGPSGGILWILYLIRLLDHSANGNLPGHKHRWHLLRSNGLRTQPPPRTSSGTTSASTHFLCRRNVDIIASCSG